MPPRSSRFPHVYDRAQTRSSSHLYSSNTPLPEKLGFAGGMLLSCRFPYGKQECISPFFFFKNSPLS